MSAEIALRVELEQPLSESFVWVDHGEADRLPKLCGEGFSLHAPGVDLDLRQFEQMMTVWVSAPYKTRDHWSNLQVGGVDGDAVDTAFGVCAHRREDGAESTTRMVADFADRGTRTPAGWRLSARTITPVFEVPQA
jgi:hypothetical protein